MHHQGAATRSLEGHAGWFDAWRGGLTLADALDRFAGGANVSEPKSRIMDRFDRLRTDPRSPLAERIEATVHLQDMARDWEEQARQLETQRVGLIGRLRSGALLALGFIVETPSSSRLAVVPREAWSDDTAVDWDGSGIQGKNAAFLDVRVLPPEWNRLNDADPGAPQLTASGP